MELDSFLNDAKVHIAETGLTDGLHETGVRNMGLVRTPQSKSKSCAVVDPLIGLVLQGRKSAQFGTQRIDYEAGDVLIVGQPVPVISSVIDATPDAPFIAVYVSLDMQVLRSVYNDMGGGLTDDITALVETGRAEAELIDAMARLFRLRRDPVEERTLGAAALREVFFRVLRSKHSRALQQMIRLDSKANQIAKAITHICNEYRTPIKASDLASIAGMSASVFYQNFKQFTSSSPLQYQKDLRLLAAHQMLQQAQASVSEIAHTVGYESAAQFSREFSRKFGAPPRAFVGAVPA